MSFNKKNVMTYFFLVAQFIFSIIFVLNKKLSYFEKSFFINSKNKRQIMSFKLFINSNFFYKFDLQKTKNPNKNKILKIEQKSIHLMFI